LIRAAGRAFLEQGSAAAAGQERPLQTSMGAAAAVAVAAGGIGRENCKVVVQTDHRDSAYRGFACQGFACQDFAYQDYACQGFAFQGCAFQGSACHRGSAGHMAEDRVVHTGHTSAGVDEAVH